MAIVLAGPPNSGKTTLFNWLTGYKARVVNYPGSTVDYCKGVLLKKYDLDFQVIDTPGIYSLFAKTPSEEIAQKILFNTRIHTVIVTVDALRVYRQLPLALQLKECGFHVVVALTMSDLAPQLPDREALSKKIGIEVYPIEGVLGKGVQELIEGIKKAQ